MPILSRSNTKDVLRSNNMLFSMIMSQKEKKAQNEMHFMSQ